MIKVKNKEVVTAVPALNILVQKELDITTAFEFSVVIKKLSEIVNTYTETKDKLQKKYGEKDDKGELVTYQEDGYTKVKIIEDKKEQFDKELEQLGNIENSISDIEKIKLKKLNGIKIAPSVISSIMFLLDK